jgi:HEAT repeat protein
VRPAGLLCLAAAACAPAAPERATPVLPRPTLAAVLDRELARTAANALSDSSSERLADFADLLDLALAGGRYAERAAEVLRDEDAAALTAGLLTLLEGRDCAPEVRHVAYFWLRERGVRAGLPRLTLRLKYEKDWVANVDLALALLRHGSGAGLEALAAILREETRQEPMFREARARASAALAALPPTDGWTPGMDFTADWQRLVTVQAAWLRDRRMIGGPRPADAALEAEVWRVLALLRSQPLRPVDDARFMLQRLPAEDAFPALLAAAADADLYVRDHALETISWIGAPVSAWSQRAGLDVVGLLAPLIGEASTRPRALEALGALGLPAAAPHLLPWLYGSAEEQTAAADGLMRSAGMQARAGLNAALADGGPWTAEAEYSLHLLRQRLDPSVPAPVSERLDAAERMRRDQWLAQRTNCE